MKALLQRIFCSERVILAAIFLNAAVLFALSFVSMENERGLLFIDNFFILFFLVEAVVKISTYGWRHYWARAWNRLDFILLLLSLPALFSGADGIPDLSVLLVLRLVRVIRLVRFLHFVPNVGSILRGLGRALRASVFVLLILFVLNFILAIFTCHLYGELAPEFFGNPIISSYTIFQLFTMEGWNEIPAVIAGRIETPWLAGLGRFYFALVVLFGGVFGLSLANAIFVDEMLVDNNDVLEQKIDRLQRQVAELTELLRR